MFDDNDDGPLWSWGDLTALLIAIALLALGIFALVHMLAIGNNANT